MNMENILQLITGLLQLVVAFYALRLNKLFGTARAGWSLFAAFILMLMLQFTREWEMAGSSRLGFGPEIVYAFISGLLLLGMVHVETTFKSRLEHEAVIQNVKRELERRVREKTAQLAEINKALRAEIAERQLKQEALAASEQKCRLLFGKNPHPMWVFNRETLAFQMVNEAAVKHYGYTEEEFLQMTIKDIVSPNDAPQFAAEIVKSSEVAQQGGTWRHLKKNGTAMDVEIATLEIKLDNENACLVRATDVTEKR